MAIVLYSHVNEYLHMPAYLIYIILDLLQNFNGKNNE